MKAFISYSHNDHRSFAQFSECLKPLARVYNIEVWADHRLKAGDYWNAKIEAAIIAADMHIMLMSNGFFGSDYIFDKELPAMAERSQQGALVLPVLLERCFWHAFVKELQVAPMNPSGRLVATKDWKPPRDGFPAACEQIAKAIEARFNIKPKSPFPFAGSGR